MRRVEVHARCLVPGSTIRPCRIVLLALACCELTEVCSLSIAEHRRRRMNSYQAGQRSWILLTLQEPCAEVLQSAQIARIFRLADAKKDLRSICMPEALLLQPALTGHANCWRRTSFSLPLSTFMRPSCAALGPPAMRALLFRC